MSWTVEYYSAAVQDEIRSWPPGIRAHYAQLTKRMLEYGSNLGMPHTAPMGDGLFEVRCKGREGIGRAIYCTQTGQQIIVLHAFIKKTEKTPPKELRIARDRMQEVMTSGHA